ncbi:MAG: serine hydrolase, partial [Muriicola sp.]
MNKNLKRLLLLLLVGLLAIIAWQYPKLNLISGFAAKSTASSIFIAGRSLNSVTENDNNVPMVKLAETHYNAAEKKGIATVFGLMEREAVCRDGLGCVLVNGDIDVELYTQIPS